MPMDRHVSVPCCNPFIPLQHDSHHLSMDAKSMIGSSSALNHHTCTVGHNPYLSSTKCQHSSYDFEKTQMTRSHSTPFSTINRHLSMPSYDQFPSMHHRFIEEDHSLRIHVGNIPFLWTVDDLCKQFLVFGPIKDPEIVSNERGSKGFGFITFLRHGDGINAIRVKNGSIADGRKITVALASTRSSNRIHASHCHCCSINNNLVI